MTIFAKPAARMRSSALGPLKLAASLAAAAALIAVPASAQQQGNPQQGDPQQGQQATRQGPSVVPPPSAMPVPSELELSKLIWSTMVMIEQANASGNYTVLRDNSATGFQINNDPARLAQIFAGLRATRIDLSTTLLTAPIYSAAPRMVQPDVLQVQGYFPLRPRAVVFDLAFQWQNGRWRLFGVAVEPRIVAQPAEPQAAPAKK